MKFDVIEFADEMGKRLKYYQKRIGVSKMTNRPTDPYKIGGNVVILGNGPSLKQFLERRAEFENYDILCMNEFVSLSKDAFLREKPSYVGLCDPVYWDSDIEDTNFYVRISRETPVILENEVTWPLKVIAPVNEKLQFTNSNISILHMNINEYFGNSKRIKKGYVCNHAIPGVNNVGLFAIYFAITFGFDNIALFGYDNNIFPTFKLCGEDLFQCHLEHFYDTPPDYMRARDLEAWFTRMGNTMEKHRRLAEYARDAGIRIRNYSTQSLLTVYNEEA